MDEQGNPWVGQSTAALLGSLSSKDEFGFVGGTKVSRSLINPNIRRELAARGIAAPGGSSSGSIWGDLWDEFGDDLIGAGRNLVEGGGGGGSGNAPPGGWISNGCSWPMRPDPVTGDCKFFVGDQPGSEGGGVGGGNAVMGRYGAAMVPDARPSLTLDCLPGMVLGKDRLCYNKGDITNKERRWPKGRAPLLTGGERNCITKASRAAKKIERTTKQLQRMGMIKKPATRRRIAPTAHKALGPGPSIINVE